MESLSEKAQVLQKKIQDAISHAHTLEELEQVRLAYLTRQSELALLMAQLKTMTPEQKKEFGPRFNALRAQAEELYESKKKQLQQTQYQAHERKKEFFDVTAYQPRLRHGSLHPYTHVIEQIENVFISMGYCVVDGPELDDEYTNFEALNVPAHHPARDMQDTLWLELPKKLMRTQTSTLQIRSMQQQKPPLAILACGRAYRYEATDATHDYVFMQTEGLLVDKNISMANLLATTKTFLAAIFDTKRIELRIRPSYFPFVEPGVEIDMQCIFCSNGCSVCKQSRWIEIVGAGLVHPNVLKACNVDPSVYTGFAFGFGLTRLTMLRYGINDIRLLHSPDLDFLKQF